MSLENLIKVLKENFNTKEEYNMDQILSRLCSIGINEKQIVISNDGCSIFIKKYYKDREAHIGLIKANNINNNVLITVIKDVPRELGLCDLNNYDS